MVTTLAASLAYLHDTATKSTPPRWPPLAFAPPPLAARASSRPLSPRALFILSLSLSLPLSLSIVINTMQVHVLCNPFCPSLSTNNVFYVLLAMLSRPIHTGHGGVSLRKATDKRALCGREHAGGQGGRLAGRWLQEQDGGD